MKTSSPFGMYAPLAVTVSLILWTVLVSPHSKYGDMWAIGPALLTLPLVIASHVYLAYKARWSHRVLLYGVAHCALFAAIWITCLMVISKDSL